MNYYIYGYTSKGAVRGENEDRILIDGRIKSDGSRYSIVSAPFITAVCDGVGGEKAGELAAQTCLEELAKVQYRSDVDIKGVVNDIHRKVKKSGVIGEGTLNMQTTLCALAVDENGEAVCINVGDSRMYRYVNAAIRQISTDQSYRQFVYEHGSEGEEKHIDPKLQNAIVSSIGSLSNDPEIEVVQLVTRFGKEPDDMILIVSDGISDFVSEQQLEIGMGLDLPIGQKLEAIAQLAVDNGSQDNISIIGIKPYITKQELEAITSDKKGETVNIQKLIAETDELGDILTFDLDEILSKPLEELIDHQPHPMPTAKPKPEPKPQETVQPEPIEQTPLQTQTTAPSEPETAIAAEDTFVLTEQTEEETMTAPNDSGKTLNDNIPDELVQTDNIGDEFRQKLSQAQDNAQTDEQPQQEGEKKKIDFSLHTIELTHQSASSLARLEKLFGKK
ncbi:MAG: protein phosphatase 2C domain-containing protein [Ruminococcus sp.]|nr:protein phosphatase 2C domain-containing protein [Ruminococcus sp.]